MPPPLVISVGNVVAVLGQWTAPDQQQDALRDSYVEFLKEHADGIWRSCAVGHVTASALVMNQARDQVLLTLHPKVGRWLQLGGHIEHGDLDLQRAARREVIEECGITPVWMSDAPLRLDRHPVPCAGRLSEHLDVQYLAVVPSDTQPVLSSESLDLAWFSITALPADLDGSVQALITAAHT